MGFPDSSAGKESVCSVGDLGSIPWLGRSPGEWKGYPLQYSGLENSMDLPPGQGGNGTGAGRGPLVEKPGVWPWYPGRNVCGGMITAPLLPLGPRRPCPPRNLGVSGSPLSFRASLLLVPQVGSRSLGMSLLMASLGDIEQPLAAPASSCPHPRWHVTCVVAQTLASHPFPPGTVSCTAPYSCSASILRALCSVQSVHLIGWFSSPSFSD